MSNPIETDRRLFVGLLFDKHAIFAEPDRPKRTIRVFLLAAKILIADRTYMRG